MTRATTIATASARETKKAAEKILHTLLMKRLRPTILALEGELGSGKTTFIQGLARGLGIKEKVQSPTFVLVKWYKLSKRRHPLRHLVHVDAYRLESLAEARHLGLRDAFRDPEAIIVIEWADRIKKLIPKNAVWIRFTHGTKPSTRYLEIKSKSKNFNF